MISFILLFKICVTQYSFRHLRALKYITSYIKIHTEKNNTCAYKSLKYCFWLYKTHLQDHPDIQKHEYKANIDYILHNDEVFGLK